MGDLIMKLVLSMLATIMIMLIALESYEKNRFFILSFVTLFFSFLIFNLIK